MTVRTSTFKTIKPFELTNFDFGHDVGSFSFMNFELYLKNLDDN